MTQALIYSTGGLIVFGIGFYGVVIAAHILQKVLAVNVMSIGVFLVLMATARLPEGPPDPVPHAMVLTGIVVAVAASAIALWLICRIQVLGNTGDDPH